MAVMTSREFNELTSEIRRTVDKEPVFITDRDRLRHPPFICPPLGFQF